MAGWQLSWRVTLTWQSARYSPTGEAVQMVDVPTPARLRELVLAARANPLILNYSYRRSVDRTTSTHAACRSSTNGPA